MGGREALLLHLPTTFGGGSWGVPKAEVSAGLLGDLQELFIKLRLMKKGPDPGENSLDNLKNK